MRNAHVISHLQLSKWDPEAQVGSSCADAAWGVRTGALQPASPRARQPCREPWLLPAGWPRLQPRWLPGSGGGAGISCFADSPLSHRPLGRPPAYTWAVGTGVLDSCQAPRRPGARAWPRPVWSQRWAHVRPGSQSGRSEGIESETDMSAALRGPEAARPLPLQLSAAWRALPGARQLGFDFLSPVTD